MNQIVGDIDSFVWGPVMLCLLVGTGIYLTAYLNFRTWRNLPYAMKACSPGRPVKQIGDREMFLLFPR